MSTTRNGPSAGSSSAVAPAKDSCALLVAAEQLGPHADDRLGRVEEARRELSASRAADVAVMRSALHAVLVERALVAAQRVERALDGGRVEPAGGVDALAQPGDRVLAVERLAGCGPSPLADEQAGGVGPAVDGGQRGHRPRTLSVDASASRSATQRPTGSSPPARCQA